MSKNTNTIMNALDKIIVKQYRPLLLMLMILGFSVVILAFFLISYIGGIDIMNYADNPWIPTLAKTIMVVMLGVMVLLMRADHLAKKHGLNPLKPKTTD